MCDYEEEDEGDGSGGCLTLFLLQLRVSSVLALHKPPAANTNTPLNTRPIQHKTQGFNLGVGPLLGLLFQALLLAARVDPRLATGLLIVSCLVSPVLSPTNMSGAGGM